MKNCRPICLMSVICKIFMSVITNRIGKPQEEKLTLSRSGLRKNFLIQYSSNGNEAAGLEGERELISSGYYVHRYLQWMCLKIYIRREYEGKIKKYREYYKEISRLKKLLQKRLWTHARSQIWRVMKWEQKVNDSIR